ncbi:MAG TPA: YciI family protein [Actinomycetota bacterium]|nr:YciI family protein [Actinomycetota bacterium]
MKYALLIYTDERARAEASPETVRKMYEAYARFGQEHGPKIRAAEELEPTATATTVRLDGGPGGDVVATDGPFAETKEQLGGFYVIEAADLDEAIKVAAAIPSAAYGSIEVRPVAPGPDARG